MSERDEACNHDGTLELLIGGGSLCTRCGATPSPAVPRREVTDRTEGFYKEACRGYQEQLRRMWADLANAKDALHQERQRSERLESEVGFWRQLAFKVGTEAKAVSDPSRNAVMGRVWLDRYLVSQAKGDVIDWTCADLAKRMTRDLFPATPPTPEGEA